VQEETLETRAAAVPERPAIAVLENSHIQKSYARWAPIYDFVFTLVLRPGRKAAAAAANRIGGHILDVGVGTGLELPMFSSNTRLTGIDLSEPMLRRAQQRADSKALANIDGLLVMDALRLAFPDAYFDAVVAPYVLTVVPDPQACLDEMARVVKRGGEIILANHIGAEKGLLGRIEAYLAKHSAGLGWRPEFPWRIIGGWIEANPNVELIERRKLPPFGLFTLARIRRL